LIQIIDDFLTPSYFEEIHNLLISWNFDWYCQPDITTGSAGHVGFSHNLYRDSPCSPHCPLILPLMLQIKDACGAKTILRCRADLTAYHPNNLKHQPHVDFKFPHYSAVFYINESDGDTVIYNEKWSTKACYPELLTVKEVVSPKPNRVVIFDGDLIHTGHSPQRYQTRVILNSNYV